MAVAGIKCSLLKKKERFTLAVWLRALRKVGHGSDYADIFLEDCGYDEHRKQKPFNSAKPSHQIRAPSSCPRAFLAAVALFFPSFYFLLTSCVMQQAWDHTEDQNS
eukprot:1161135-Pelagomonas_calceolata.AAC.2